MVLYPPSKFGWNISSVLAEEKRSNNILLIGRTNNANESRNGRMNSALGPHPAMAVFVAGINKLMCADVLMLEQIQKGVRTPPHPVVSPTIHSIPADFATFQRNPAWAAQPNSTNHWRVTASASTGIPGASRILADESSSDDEAMMKQPFAHTPFDHTDLPFATSSDTASAVAMQENPHATSSSSGVTTRKRRAVETSSSSSSSSSGGV